MSVSIFLYTINGFYRFFTDMNQILSIILSFLLVHLAANPLGQQKPVNGWLMSTNIIKLNNKFGVHFDGQLRSSDEQQKLQTILPKPGLNFTIIKNIIATVG